MGKSIKTRFVLCGMATLFTLLHSSSKANGRSGVCNGCTTCNGNCFNGKLVNPIMLQKDTNKNNYYETKKKDISEEFEMNEPFLRKELAKKYASNTVETMIKQMKSKYESLCVSLPYIGGDENSLTQNLVSCTVYLSAYQVLKNYNMSAEKVGNMISSVVSNEFRTFFSKEERTKMGKEQFTKKYIDTLKIGAKESLKKRYVNDWVYTVSDGDKKSFDYGIDYTECGVAKFFHQQKADEFTPYMCKLDFSISDALGLGLKRTGTIAEGKKKCDFRYKLGQIK